MSDPAENRGVRGNVIKPYETNPEVPIKQPYLSTAAILNIVGSNLGQGLTFDPNKNLIEANGSGISRQNIAETFAESSVSLTHSGTKVNNGKIVPYEQSYAMTTDSTTKYGPADRGPYQGDLFEIGNVSNIESVIFDLHPDNGWAMDYGDTAYFKIWEVSSSISGNFNLGNEVYSGDGFTYGNAKSSRTIDGSVFSSNQAYAVGWYNAEDNFQIASPENPTYSGEISEVNTYNAFYQSDNASQPETQSGFSNGINKITLVEASGVSGNTIIEWTTGPGDDIYQWDTASYIPNTAGTASIDVYVEYSSDGGSTWSDANGGSPISRQYNLSGDADISASDDVRLRYEFSRGSVSDTAELEAAYRSWSV